MAVTLKSEIILCKNIRLDKSYTNVLNYTENQMLSLCRSNNHLVASDDDYSFIRTTGNIFTNFSYNQCLQSNYIAFQNKDYSNKWFFAFIDEVIYKGDSNTEIRYTIDSWTTWFENWTKKKCFIERQHENIDTIGSNLIEENLNVGDVEEIGEVEDASYTSEYGYWVAVASNWKIKDGSNGFEIADSDHGTQFAGVTMYDNTIFGNEIYLIHIVSLQDIANLYLFISRTNMDKHVADIQNLFIVPDALIDLTKITQHTAKLGNNLTFTFYTLNYDMEATKFDTEIDKITSFDDFVPKNKKCFIYPYNYLMVTNNQGSQNIFRYEDFGGNKCQFENQISLSIGCSGRLVPKNYKNMSSDDDEAIPLGKYPTCAWSSDAYTNWLTQNSVNLATSMAMTLGGVGLGIATGGASVPVMSAMSALASGNANNQLSKKEFQSAINSAQMGLSVAGNIANTIGSFRQASLLPNIQGGQATGDIIWANNRNTFTFKQMRCKRQFLQIIDDYFTRFGYAIKRLEMPNITGRRNWNYIQIGSSECIGYGDVPSMYMEEINSACRRGVTIWHTHDNIGDFSLDNSII